VLRKLPATAQAHAAPRAENQANARHPARPRGREGATGGWPEQLLTASPTQPVTLHTDDGHVLPVDATRWHRAADVADESVLDRVVGSVLDVGSGPGRIVAALAARGHDALGIDISHRAVAYANRSRARSVVADVFGPVPRGAEWSTALLLDGNVGIGGDVPALLSRVRDLVHPGGRLVVETANGDGPRGGRRARVVHGDHTSDWFDWTIASLNDVLSHAPRTGWRLAETWTSQDRSFCLLQSASRPCPG